MKKKYSRPMLTTEEYLLNQVVAGACAGGSTAISQPGTPIGGEVHCYSYKNNGAHSGFERKKCSADAHTWTVLTATVFADGSSDANGCTTDVYSRADYDNLFLRGSTISGDFAFVTIGGERVIHAKGNSDQHLIRLSEAQYNPTIVFRS